MTKDREALILGRDRAGTLDGVVVLQVRGTSARLRALVAKTRADMEKRGLTVAVSFADPHGTSETNVTPTLH